MVYMCGAHCGIHVWYSVWTVCGRRDQLEADVVSFTGHGPE